MIDPPVVVVPPADNVLWSVWNERVRRESNKQRERYNRNSVFLLFGKTKKKRREIQNGWGPQLFHFSPAM
jgi:hypothetical protein